MKEIMFLTLFLLLSQSVWAQGDAATNLRAVQSVSKSNIKDVTRLLYTTAVEVDRNWDEDLIRELGRVIDLSMNYDSSIYTITDPLDIVLLSDRRAEFVALITAQLNEVNKPEFKRLVETLLMVSRNGNG